MAKVYLVWNEDHSECVGFTDKEDALQASGDEPVKGSSCSTLAEFFRSNYADEDIFDGPIQVFDLEEVDAL